MGGVSWGLGINDHLFPLIYDVPTGIRSDVFFETRDCVLFSENTAENAKLKHFSLSSSNLPRAYHVGHHEAH